MTERHPDGQVWTEVVADHVLHMAVEREEKRNAFTPKLMDDLATALTRLDDDAELWVGVLSFAGPHTTAGLAITRFFRQVRPFAVRQQRGDTFGLGRQTTHPA